MFTLLAQVHGHEESWFQEYLELLTDPAHLLLELTLIIIVDVLIGMLAWPFIKKAIARHDEKKHGHEHCDEVHPATVTIPVAVLNGVEYVRVSDLQTGNNSFDKDFE